MGGAAAQHLKAAPGQGADGPAIRFGQTRLAILVHGVDNGFPTSAFGQGEDDLGVAGVEHQQEGIVGLLTAPAIQVGQAGFARKTDGQGLTDRIAPIGLGHLLAVRAQPDDILDLGSRNHRAGKEAGAVEDHMFAAQAQQAGHEGDLRARLFVDAVPVQPA